MVAWIVELLAMAASVLVVTRVVPGISCKGFKTALKVAATVAVLNFVVFRLLFFLSAPFILFTAFIGYFILDALILWAADELVDGFEVKGPRELLIGSVALGITNWVLGRVVHMFL